MARKSWHLDRRTFLRGAAGATLALPWMEAMAVGAAAKAELPKRFCAVYWPYGVALPKDGSSDRNWGWFPIGEGKNFRFTDVLASMEPLRQNVTVIGGISHPGGWSMGGHDTADIFLTGAGMKNGALANTISLDQLVASKIGQGTRFSSLTLSSEGGIGTSLRTNTLSYSPSGSPIPSLSSPRQVYDRLFGREAGSSVARQRQRLKENRSMLDLVLEHSKSLNRRLGKQDQKKFDEYLTSVRVAEQRVERAESWLDIPKPKVDEKSLDVDATHEGPKEYIAAMYDLMYLAFQTDSTRSAAYLLGKVNGKYSLANTFPGCLGLQANWHGLAHGHNKPGGAQKLGKFDQFLAQNHARFLQKMADAKEGDGSLLDRTLVLYGSSNSNTHNNHNYPLLLAGGKGLGVKHGQYLRYNEKDMPLSNLYITMLDRLGIPAERFADSTGEFSDILASR